MRVGRVERVSPDGKVETIYDRTTSEGSTQESVAAGPVLCRVCDIQRQELRWLWPGRIPLGKLTLFAGDPGLGKSFVTLDIGARVTRGKRWPDHTTTSCEPGSVIILSAEDDPADTIRPRLEAADADLSRVHILRAVRRAKPNGETSLEHFSLETDLVALQDAVALLGDVRLIVIDPISAYLGRTDSHVNSKVRSLLSPLAEIASGLGVAVVAVTHLNKNISSALYRATGSIAFVAAARAVWLFAKNPDDPGQRLMLPGKMNLAPDQTGLSYTLQEMNPGFVAVAWGGVVSVSADVALQPERGEEKSALLEAKEWLQDMLSAGPVSAKQIQKGAAAAGIAWATVRRAKAALAIIHRKSSFGGGWEWALQDVQREGAQAHPFTMSTFEHRTENKVFNNHRQQEDAHSVGMSTFEEGEL